jgi:hypothetical protein
MVTGSAASALLLLGLAACGPAPRQDAPADNAAGGNSANAVAAAPAAETSAQAPLVLDGSGLRIGGAAAPRTIAFDSPQAGVVEALTAALGGPPTERGSNSDCGEGAMEFAEWKDRITVWFQEGRFAGWSSEGELGTGGGIRVGSARAEVAALPGFEVEERTLGTEFRVSGLSGLFASNAADARVTHLWAGSTCVFR